MNKHIETNDGTADTPSRWRRTSAGALVLLAAGTIAWYLTHRAPIPSAEGRSSTLGLASFAGGNHVGPTSVGITISVPANAPQYVDALGTVTPVATVNVKAQVSGVLTQILFTEGQVVRAGQVLALIDSRPYEMAVQQAVGQRQRDEAQLELARMTLQRDRALLQKDAIAKQDLDTQAALVKQLEGSVVSDQAAEGVARLNLAYTRILAPINGRVGLRVVDAGNVVNPSDVNGVAVITQTTPVDVVFSVPQDLLPDLQAEGANNPHWVVTALDRSLTQVLDQGFFATTDNQIDAQSGTVRAKARFANAHGRLFPHQFVNVRMALAQRAEGVTVPLSAVRTGSGGDFVYVLNADQTVSVRQVSPSQATATSVTIARGLKVGEKVVSQGADHLRDGAPVVVRPAPSNTSSASSVSGQVQR